MSPSLSMSRALWKVFVKIAFKLGLYSSRTTRYFNVIRRVIKGQGAVLDVGCGNDVFSRLLVRSSLSRLAVCLDIDRGGIESLRGDLQVLALNADALEIPLREGSMDYVIVLSVLEHLHQPSKAVDEILRVLSPGGLIIVQLPNLGYLVEPHTKIPLPMLYPHKVKEAIRRNMGYAYINWGVILKNVKKTFEEKGAREIARVKIYHGLKTPPWPAGWFLIFRKPLLHNKS